MKKPWLSKTMWMSAITALVGLWAPLVPSVEVWISAPGNLATIGMLWGAASAVLRLVTKDKIVLTD
jgi:hypothetical protein